MPGGHQHLRDKPLVVLPLDDSDLPCPLPNPEVARLCPHWRWRAEPASEAILLERWAQSLVGCVWTMALYCFYVFSPYRMMAMLQACRF